ncbi:hypothetical protein ACO0QE_003048 [Hanseniaspora vineae]
MDFTSDSIQLDLPVSAQARDESSRNNHALKNSALSSSALSPTLKKNVEKSKINKRQSSLFFSRRSSSFLQQSDSGDEAQGDINNSSSNLTDDVDAKQLKLIELNEERSRLLLERQKAKKEIESFKAQLKTIDHESSESSEQNAYEQLFLLRLDWALNLPNALKAHSMETGVSKKANASFSTPITIGPFDSLEREQINTFDMKPMVNIESRRKHLQNQYPLLRINETSNTQDDTNTSSIEIDIDGFRFDIFTNWLNGKYHFKIDGDFLSLRLASDESTNNLHNVVRIWANEGNIQNIIHLLYAIIESNNTKRDFYQDFLPKFIRYSKKTSERPSSEWLSLERKDLHVTIFWEIEIDENGHIQNTLTAVKNFENDRLSFEEKITEQGLKKGLFSYLQELFPLD